MPKKNNLLNRSAVRQKAMAVLQDKRPHLATKFTRISSDFFTAIELDLEAAIEKRIMSAPSVGKTLTTGEPPRPTVAPSQYVDQRLTRFFRRL